MILLISDVNCPNLCRHNSEARRQSLVLCIVFEVEKCVMRHGKITATNARNYHGFLHCNIEEYA
jgi:hypothetical protein